MSAPTNTDKDGKSAVRAQGSLEIALKLADLLNRTTDVEPSDTRLHLRTYPMEVTEVNTAVIASSLPRCANVSLQCRRVDEQHDANSYSLLWESERCEDGGFGLFVRCRPLPLGEVAVVSERLSSRTRISSHATDLDVSQWIESLRNVSTKDLIADLGQTLTVDFRRIAEKVQIGTTLSEFIGESQSFECKFPSECSSKNLREWPRKMFNKEFIPVLNGAGANEEVELWLGVRDQSWLMLGAAFSNSQFAFSDSLNVFPPVTEMVVEEYRVATPTKAGKYYVRWCHERKAVWENITSLKGRGWLIEVGDKFGVVMDEDVCKATDDVLDEALLGNVQFDRSILRVKVKSRYPRAYINKDIRFGDSLQIYPFEVWLRLHSSERSSFFERFSYCKSLSLRIAGGDEVDAFPAKFSLPGDQNKIEDALYEQNSKDRYALVDVERVEDLEKLIRFDRDENVCEKPPGSICTKWFVGLIVPELPNGGQTQSALFEKVQNAVRKLHSLRGVKIEEIKLSMGNSLQTLVLGNRLSHQGISYDHNSIDVVNEDLVSPDELADDLGRMAKSWICPEDERDRGEPSWTLVKAGYVIRTEYVDEVVSSIGALLSPASYRPKQRIVRVSSRFPGNGLSSVLRLAAWTCGVAANTTVLFLKDVQDEEKISRTIEQFVEKGRVIIFCDREIPSALFVQRFSEHPACVLVLGSRSETDFDDVVIRAYWSVDCLKKLCCCLEGLPFRHPQETITHALETALAEVASVTEGPFYVFPWVASMGRYVPVRDCIKRQVDKASQLYYSSILDSVAFFSLTLRKESLDNVIFPEALNDSDFPLLVRTRRRHGGNYAYRFVHSEMAHAHLSFVWDKDWDVGGPNESCFPANFCPMWTESIADVLTHLGAPRSNQVLDEIAYAPESRNDFTPFISYVTSKPREQAFLDSFVSVSDKVRIPVVDRLILMSRMEAQWGDFDKRLKLAHDAYERAKKTADELKARNNLAQSLAELAIATTKDLNRREQLWRESMSHFDYLQKKANTDEKRRNLDTQIKNNTTQFENSNRPTKQRRGRARTKKTRKDKMKGSGH